MIRWWSLGSVWWEKLSRNLVPVQCSKLIFVPPWEGFSPNSTRSSIMASVLRDDGQANSLVVIYVIFRFFHIYLSLFLYESAQKDTSVVETKQNN